MDIMDHLIRRLMLVLLEKRKILLPRKIGNYNQIQSLTVLK